MVVMNMNVLYVYDNCGGDDDDNFIISLRLFGMKSLH